MKTETIRVSVYRESVKTFEEIPAYRATPNFAVHHHLTSSFKPPQLGFDSIWSLTHVPTGRALFECQTRRDAVAAAELLEPLCDWSAIGVKGTQELPEETREAIRKVRHDWAY